MSENGLLDDAVHEALRLHIRCDPSRTVRAGTKRHAFAFGAGPHTCIGKAFVLGSDGEERGGAARSTLAHLYASGMRLDPERPPQLNRGNVRGERSSVPVWFDP